jgi:hypothetical protein
VFLALDNLNWPFFKFFFCHFKYIVESLLWIFCFGYYTFKLYNSYFCISLNSVFSET